MRLNTLKSIAAATLTITVVAERRTHAQLVPGQWHQTWADEFNAGASDLTGWTHETGGGGWGNNESEVYSSSLKNSFVSGGALRVDAIATGTGASQTYTSARIKSDTLFTQAFGLFEFRAKLPAGTGLWPALWMMPRDSTYGGWPRSGEIDVLESKGQDATIVQGSLHSGPSSGTLNTQSRHFADSGLEPANFSTTDWHTYDLQWTGGSGGNVGNFRWYVDGVSYQTRAGGWSVPASASAGDKDAPFDQPFYIIMNLAVGGNYVGAPSLAPDTYEMQVDYVRGYRILADATGDGLVNSDDLAVLMQHYGAAVTEGYSDGDFDGDGRVTESDLAIFNHAVPEPSTAVTAMLLLLIQMRERRRRAQHGSPVVDDQRLWDRSGRKQSLASEPRESELA